MEHTYDIITSRLTIVFPMKFRFNFKMRLICFSNCDMIITWTHLPTTNYDNIDFNKWQSAKQWRWKNRNSSGRVYSTLQINWTLIPSAAGTELMSIKSSRNTKSFRFKLFKSWRSLGEKSCQFWNVCNNVFVQSLSIFFFSCKLFRAIFFYFSCKLYRANYFLFFVQIISCNYFFSCKLYFYYYFVQIIFFIYRANYS